jgi:hypothetical protein
MHANMHEKMIKYAWKNVKYAKKNIYLFIKS